MEEKDKQKAGLFFKSLHRWPKSHLFLLFFLNKEMV
ncbi:hypothetical protein CHY_0468 [Carboxydothermus hydrogenoformans Z-2901]|uniref:Uncharacterized protein n=1 Tax=Carboxydothermus hydrogenoformans (strain ATCC BAA-161 / DSM 6008 / Z-2901) TaxID=246194 RepID=Q3AEV8_CARHZ|nr:hypothetical protein CHY_0468 [Carboxydothermus hydrogenoformans Z-2901]